jgi:hypothetical protein
MSLIGALLTAGWAHAQGAKFAQRERIQLAMDNSPELVINALESILSHEQLAALEAALLPPPTDAEKQEALDSAKLKLLRAGFADDDPLVAAIAARAGEIAVEVPSDPAASAKE